MPRSPALLVALALAHPVVAQPSFTPLGFPQGYTASVALAISGDGGTVCGQAGNSARAWYWGSAGGFTLIPATPFGTPTEARALTPNGAVITGVIGSTGGSFRYTVGDPSSFFVPGYGASGRLLAFGISGDGQTLIGDGFTPANNHVPTAWNLATGFRFLPADQHGYAFGECLAANADASIIVGEVHSSASSIGNAFRWTAASGTVGLGVINPDQPQSFTVGLDASADCS